MATRTKRGESQQALEPQPNAPRCCLGAEGAGERQHEGTKLRGHAGTAAEQSPPSPQKAPEM